MCTVTESKSLVADDGVSGQLLTLSLTEGPLEAISVLGTSFVGVEAFVPLVEGNSGTGVLGSLGEFFYDVQAVLFHVHA